MIFRTDSSKNVNVGTEKEANAELSCRETESQVQDIPTPDTLSQVEPVAVVSVQMTEDELEIFSGSLQPDQREKQRLEKKPNVDHFELGIAYDEVSGVYTPLFEPGSKIVAERYASCLPGNPWLDTRVYTVLSVDDPEPGVVHCFEDEVKHHAFLGYSHPHTVIRLWTPPERGKNPFKATTATAAQLRQRQHSAPTPPQDISSGDILVTPGQTAESAPNSDVGAQKRRGRKPGTKNRSRAEIIADKAEKEARRALKKKRGKKDSEDRRQK